MRSLNSMPPFGYTPATRRCVARRYAPCALARHEAAVSRSAMRNAPQAFIAPRVPCAALPVDLFVTVARYGLGPSSVRNSGKLREAGSCRAWPKIQLCRRLQSTDVTLFHQPALSNRISKELLSSGRAARAKRADAIIAQLQALVLTFALARR